jgi:hypothetical protein
MSYNVTGMARDAMAEAHKAYKELIAVTAIVDRLDTEATSFRDETRKNAIAYEARIDGKQVTHETRVDNKLNAFEQRLDAKLNAIEQRFDAKIAAVEKRMHDLENRFSNLEGMIATNYAKVIDTLIEKGKSVPMTIKPQTSRTSGSLSEDVYNLLHESSRFNSLHTEHLAVVVPNVLPPKCASAARETGVRCHGVIGSMARA